MAQLAHSKIIARRTAKGLNVWFSIAVCCTVALYAD
jgi:hypothetical protein